jgi:hypothetical protein
VEFFVGNQVESQLKGAAKEADLGVLAAAARGLESQPGRGWSAGAFEKDVGPLGFSVCGKPGQQILRRHVKGRYGA